MNLQASLEKLRRLKGEGPSNLILKKNSDILQKVELVSLDPGLITLDVFQECRSLLKKDLGTEPDEQTVTIYQKIKSR